MARVMNRTPYSSRATKKAKGVLKKFNPFKAKGSGPKTPTLRGFKNVRPTPVKKAKKSTGGIGITATSTPKGTKKARRSVETSKQAEETPDYIPLEAGGSPSPAIRRSGRKKTLTTRFAAQKPPPSPATLLAREKRGTNSPIVIDITATEDDEGSNDVELLGDRNKARKRTAATNSKNNSQTREPGEIVISDDECTSGVMIVGEKQLRPFPPVLNRDTPAKAKQGYAEYARENHRQQRRNQPYPTMGTKASSRSRLRGSTKRGSWGQWHRGAESTPNLHQLQQLPIFRDPPQTARPPKSPSSAVNPDNLIQAVGGPLFKTGKRPIVIDGSNVAVQHSIATGRGARFSCQGIKICVDFFQQRGHEVTVFVPQYRTKSGQSDDRHLLDQLYKTGTLAFTPSASYDDRYVLQYAQTVGGIVVSNDQYKDIMNESPELHFVATRRKLGFTWVKNTLMFPQDPMGRDGPTLDRFLKY